MNIRQPYLSMVNPVRQSKMNTVVRVRLTAQMLSLQTKITTSPQLVLKKQDLGDVRSL